MDRPGRVARVLRRTGGRRGASASAATPTAAIRPATCSGTVQITSPAFQPPTVAPGQSSAATLAARNCRAQAVQATSYSIGSTTGIPTGCPVIDPLPHAVTFAPYARVTMSTTYLVLQSCTDTALQVTVRIAGSGGITLVSRTATLTIQH